MANIINWGQAAVENTIDYGQGATDNTISWGKSQTLSPSGETNITGAGGTPAFTNTLSTTFDGTDDFVNIGTPLNLRFNRSNSFTFSAWVNVSAIGNNVILSNQRAPSTNYRGYYFAVQSNKLIVLFRSTLSDRLIFNGATNLSSGWNHVVFTYDGSATTSGGQLYINGSADTTTGSGTLTGTAESFDTLYLGCRSGADNFFNGNIDEVSVFNTELSSSDVTAIYNIGTPTDLTSYSPISWWRMGDGSTYPTINDLGSGSNDGTMTNMSSANFVTDVPT